MLKGYIWLVEPLKAGPTFLCKEIISLRKGFVERCNNFSAGVCDGPCEWGSGSAETFAEGWEKELWGDA